MNYFWVNVGETYKEVAENNFLWAPLPYVDEKGVRKNNAGWSPLEKAKLGDVFFCKNGNYFEYVAVVTNDAYEYKRPTSRSFDRWKLYGRRVDVSLIKLRQPLFAPSISEHFLENYYESCEPKVVNKDGKFCEIYSSHLPDQAGRYILKKISESSVLEHREEIIQKSVLNKNFPIQSHSWEVISESVINKLVDKTFIKEKSTGIPNDIVSFFTSRPLKDGEKVSLKLSFNENVREIELQKKPDGRHKLSLAEAARLTGISKLKIGDKYWFERDEEDPFKFHVIHPGIKNSYKLPKVTYKPKTTSKERVVKTRYGQDFFKSEVSRICEHRCLVTGVKDQKPSILIGSHIKPWKESSDIEKLDGENGLLLAPHIDKVFDTHLITFSPEGKIIVSPNLGEGVLEAWGVDLDRTYSLTEQQQNYMTEHRKKFKEKAKA